MGRLQQELKKKLGFDSPEQEAMLNLFRSSDQLHNRFGKLFREYGLTNSQYNVLRILRGEARPMACQEIVDRMIQVVPAMTGLLDRLEAQGMIERQRSLEDRRSVQVRLSAAARALLARLDQPVAALHRDLLGHLSVTELRQLTELLEKARSPREL